MDKAMSVSRYLHLKRISDFKMFNLFMRGFENKGPWMTMQFHQTWTQSNKPTV